MSTRVSVICFLLLTAALGGYYGAPFLGKGDKLAHLPGETSHGHHQIEVACEQCHTPFGGVKNDACSRCHGASLAAESDSHSDFKFADPRNAERSAGLDARSCVTCHREHVPERTRAGVTVASDFCVKCHLDVIQERPSHKEFAHESCGNSGCHNFHDNRALYEDFLVKHLHEPEQLATARVPLRDSSTAPEPAGAIPIGDGGAPTDGGLALDSDGGAAVDRDGGALDGGALDGGALDAGALDGGVPALALDAGHGASKQLTAKDRDAPAEAGDDAALTADWEKTAHAAAGVSCRGCHQQNDPSSGASTWQTKIDRAACVSCHATEDAGFLAGLHGMRLAVKLPPMTPELAQLPMKAGTKHEPLGCNSCHRAHTYDTAFAAVESCLGCHDDEHTLAYKASRHFRLWELEQSGQGAKGTGVSCATCHLPREVHKEGGKAVVSVQHNQNANLRPNDKMIRSVCASCHGLGFSMDALADPEMLRRNFNGRPGRHVTSLEMAEKRLKKKTGE
jgi:Cytochrome c3